MHPLRTITIFVIGSSLALGAVMGLTPAPTTRSHKAVSVTTAPASDQAALSAPDARPR